MTAILLSIRPGTRRKIGDVFVERTGNYYRINGSSHTLEKAAALIPMPQAKSKTDPLPDGIGEILTFPDELRAMSVHGPWAYMITKGYKLEEYRTKATKLRGWILIHCSQSKDSDDFILDYKLPKATIDKMRGKIIGAAHVDDCYFMPEDDCYAYELSQAMLFEPKFWMPAKGQQSIFWAASGDPERMAAFGRAWQLIEAQAQ